MPMKEDYKVVVALCTAHDFRGPHECSGYKPDSELRCKWIEYDGYLWVCRRPEDCEK